MPSLVVERLEDLHRDGPMRWLGPDNWKRLHRVGVWIIAVIFAGSFLTRMPNHAGYAVPAMIVIAAMLLRVIARLGKTRRQGTAASAASRASRSRAA
ncbi:hypothetical protein [Cupriavidus oxalaticus]|uniref:hypothetical protein n=1 Tax=Cupriavidus oxalaticus TaxID=96344 RepID=UPI00317E1CE4